MQNPVSLIASMFALCAFVVALAAGVSAENGGALVLRHGVVAMFVAYVVASVVASVARGAIVEHLKARARASGATGTMDRASASAGAPDVVEVVSPQVS